MTAEENEGDGGTQCQFPFAERGFVARAFILFVPRRQIKPLHQAAGGGLVDDELADEAALEGGGQTAHLGHTGADRVNRQGVITWPDVGLFQFALDQNEILEKFKTKTYENAILMQYFLRP